MNKKHLTLLLLTTLLTTTAAAQTAFDNTQAEEDAKEKLQQRADSALTIIQYIGFIIATPFGSYQGYKYITSENDPAKRNEAKNRLGQIIVGLVIIEAFPLIIQWLF